MNIDELAKLMSEGVAEVETPDGPGYVVGLTQNNTLVAVRLKTRKDDENNFKGWQYNYEPAVLSPVTTAETAKPARKPRKSKKKAISDDQPIDETKKSTDA